MRNDNKIQRAKRLELEQEQKTVNNKILYNNHTSLTDKSVTNTINTQISSSPHSRYYNRAPSAGREDRRMKREQIQQPVYEFTPPRKQTYSSAKNRRVYEASDVHTEENSF